jgi:hypothetical protein
MTLIERFWGRARFNVDDIEFYSFLSLEIFDSQLVGVNESKTRGYVKLKWKYIWSIRTSSIDRWLARRFTVEKEDFLIEFNVQTSRLVIFSLCARDSDHLVRFQDASVCMTSCWAGRMKNRLRIRRARIYQNDEFRNHFRSEYAAISMHFQLTKDDHSVEVVAFRTFGTFGRFI